MCRAEHDLRGRAGLVRLEPARCAQAPAVAGLEAFEAPLRAGRREVVPGLAAELEELLGHHRADRVAALVLRPRPATAVAVEARHRLERAGQQLAADDVEVGLAA